MSKFIWQKKYPTGVENDIDPSKYNSVVELLVQSVPPFRDNPAYVNFGRTLSFNDIDRYSRDFAAYLQNSGLKPGDRIALQMPNLLQYPIALFGSLRAGLIVVNTNPLYTPREMEHQFKSYRNISKFCLKLREDPAQHKYSACYYY